MSKQLLKYSKNLRAVIVFLNMFNLEVLEKENVVSGDILSVVDDNMQVVGYVTFRDLIEINVTSSIGVIKASFKPAFANVGRDVEAINAPRYGAWNTEIHYEILKNSSERFQGLCRIEASIDDEFGLNTLVRHKLKYFINNSLFMDLKMQLDGAVFDLTLYNNDEEERISIRPFSLSGSLMRHEIKKGEYIREIGYPNHFYTSILSGESAPTLIVIRSLEEMGEYLDFKREEMLKENYNPETGSCGRGVIMQLGSIMHKFEPSCYEKINDIREVLALLSGSLLDGFINTSMSSYSEMEIETLMGIKKKPIKYQGRVRELKEIYFGNDGRKFLN